MTRISLMGCDVLVSSTDRLARNRRRLFEERDRRFSRFHDHSELNHVNAHPFGVTLVSEDSSRRRLSLALDAAHATGGLGDASRRWRSGRRRLRPRLRLASPRGRCGRAGASPFAALPAAARANAPAHRARGADLNGVVKGKTVDDALARVGEGWVSAGGDIATTVPLDVGLPGGGSIRLDRGGLATSSITKRSWRRGGELQHHLIDPATGRPARTPWRDVSVAARSLRRGRHRRESGAPPRAGRAVMARPARPRGALRRPSRRSPTDPDLAAVRA